MIVQFKSRKDSQDEYVIALRSSLSLAEVRDQMLERAKVVKGSYAHELIRNLHAAIFIGSLDLKNDYHTYFEREYGSFSDYLKRRARLPASIVPKLEEVHDLSSGIYHYCSPLYFLAEEYGLEFLSRLLEDPPVEEEE